MEKSQLDWGDLLYLYTLANSETLLDAAESLEVNRTTVSRRIDNLEEALGAKLFVKSGRDLVLTEVGQMVLQSAEAIREQVIALKRDIRSRDAHLEGVVRITTTPKICRLIEPALSRFLLDHPQMKLELSSSMAAENLEKLESDIAIRLITTPPDTLIGRKLAEPGSAVYASAEFAAKMPKSGALRLLEGAGPLSVKTWLADDLGYSPDVVLKTNSTDAVVHFVRSGVGAAYLPCYVGEQEPDLVRVSDVRREGMPDLWLLYPQRHRDAPRIKAIADVVSEAFNELRPMVEGKQLEA